MGLILLPMLLFVSSAKEEAEVPVEEVRQAIRRSIPFIEEEGDWWIEENECVSCHRVSNMVWTLREAQRHGFEVSDRLEEWTQWATENSLSKNDKGKVVGLGNKEGVAQLLLSLRNSADLPASQEKLVKLLMQDQQANGSWKPGGQLPTQKRPKPETSSVSTMWITLALLEENPGAAENRVIQQAMDHIQNSKPGNSIEWYVLRLLLATQVQDVSTQHGMLEALRAHQRDDGGWGWLYQDESDALGTGMALYAMIQAGEDRGGDAVLRAQRFLVNSQAKDGSWLVKGTKANKKTKPQTLQSTGARHGQA